MQLKKKISSKSVRSGGTEEDDPEYGYASEISKEVYLDDDDFTDDLRALNPEKLEEGKLKEFANLAKYKAKVDIWPEDAPGEIVDGKWWPSDYEGPPLISIEEEAAKNTGLAIGDQISFFIAGNEIEAEISSIRKVNWDSFQPNFFITLSPFALDNMPTTFVSSMHIEDTGQSLFPELLKLHPSISIIDLGVIIEQVENIIKNASSAVQVIFLFTIGLR